MSEENFEIEEIIAEDSVESVEESDVVEGVDLDEGKKPAKKESKKDSDEDEGDDEEELEEGLTDGDAKVDVAQASAPTTKGDAKSVKAPGTKFGMLAAMNNHMAKMDKVAMNAMYKKVMEGVDEDSIDTQSYDFSEDLDALTSGEDALSEGFRSQAGTIMEAAVAAKVATAVENLEEQYAEELSAELNEFTDGMVNKVDEYLNYVVENFMADNALAITNGLRTEIAEDFMGKLHSVFTESYIEVPESKVDFVDSLAEENAELKGKLNQSIELGLSVNEELKVLQRAAIVAESAESLTATQAEKLAELAEGVEFVSEGDFQEKMDTLVSSYFSAKTKTVTSDLVEEEVEVEATPISETADPLMAATLAALRSKK